jgi:hypothetical protein
MRVALRLPLDKAIGRAFKVVEEIGSERVSDGLIEDKGGVAEVLGGWWRVWR